MKSLIAVLLIVVLSITACAKRDPKVWYQPGMSETQIRKDWAESQLAAHKALLSVRPPEPHSDNSFAAGAAAGAHRQASNAAAEIAPLTMQSKGYQLVPLSTVPTNSAYLKP